MGRGNTTPHSSILLIRKRIYYGICCHRQLAVRWDLRSGRAAPLKWLDRFPAVAARGTKAAAVRCGGRSARRFILVRDGRVRRAASARLALSGFRGRGRVSGPDRPPKAMACPTWISAIGDMISPLIEFRNVSVRRGERLALDGVTLCIAQGENVAILGPNGSGKSTLIKAIAREVYPLVTREGSEVRVLGEDCWNLFELRSRLGLVSNDWTELCHRDYSGFEMVLSGFFGSVGVWPYHTVTPAMARKAREVMELLEIPHLAGRATNEVSSGEARRILIARALVHDPAALILDEPSSSLDLRACYELREILRKLAASGIAIVMVTHHLNDIIPEMRRVILIREGRVHYDGAAEGALTSEALSALFGIPVEVVEREGRRSAL